MQQSLTFDLHALTARLDRAADRILQAEFQLSYRRFLTLVVLAELGSASQRTLAQALAVSEPSLSRMTGVLARTELLAVSPDPAGGNRRRLCLTPQGKELVERCRDLLERSFSSLVEDSSVPYAEYSRHTRALLTALENADRPLPARRSSDRPPSASLE